MKHLKITFEDIMQSNILFYDKQVEEACFDICEALCINNLPALNGKMYYLLGNNKFEKKRINKIHKLSIHDNIFNNKLLKRFEHNNHNVLFVFESNTLSGVVHLADYNQNIVLQAIQDDILSFERNLRQYLSLLGYDNDSFMQYFNYKLRKPKGQKDKEFIELKIHNLDARKEEMGTLGLFQLFEFSDLINFCNSSFSKTKFNIPNIGEVSCVKRIIELRNLAMHGKNPVSREFSSSIYSIESLSVFFENLRIFREYSEKLLGKIKIHPDYLKSVEWDNRKKLEIIHKHHPKAMNYFLGGTY